MHILEIYQTDKPDLFYFKRYKKDKIFIKSLFTHKIYISVLKDKVLVYETSLNDVIEIAKNFYDAIEIVETIEDDSPSQKQSNTNNEQEEKWLKLFQYMDIRSLSDLKKNLAKKYHPDTSGNNSSEDMAIINGIIDDLIGASNA